ncbi:MAG: SPFH domain-containing protein [Oligoflexus sp.]
MLLAFTIFVVAVVLFIKKMIVVVPMHENYVVERLGKFKALLEPGFYIVIPIIDRIAYRHEMREQVFDIPAQSCITRDNIQVEVDGLVYLKVMDAHRSSYGIGDYIMASINLAQTTMRSEIGKLALGETFSERDKLNEAIVREIDKASDPWGIKVLRYELRNISPSVQVVHTLERQMEAERQKRAEITLATAQRESKILISEGHRQEAINISEGQKQKMINESNGRAQSISIVANATAEGMRLVAEAAQKSGGSMAIKMRLAETFIEQFGAVLDKSKVSIMPADLAHIKGVLNSLSLGLDHKKTTANPS